MNKNFINELKKSLDSGEENADIKNRLMEIEEKADKVNVEDVEKKIERIQGEQVEMTPEEREIADNEHAEAMKKIREEEDVLRKLAAIENYKFEIISVEKEYKMILRDMNEMLDNLINEFEADYGSIENAIEKYKK